jgi:hypothetical protein
VDAEIEGNGCFLIRTPSHGFRFPRIYPDWTSFFE